MNKQYKSTVFGILIIFTLLLGSLPLSIVHSQTGGDYVCGQWSFVNSTGRLGGWWFNPWPFDGQHPSWVMRNVPQGWGLEMNGAYTKISHPTLDESYSLGPIVLDIGSYEVVSSCNSTTDLAKVNIKPINRPLPFSSICSKKVAISIDKNNMPADWQKAIASAGQTWAQAGSKLIFSSNTIKDSQRTYTATDYEGSTINVSNNPLTLAKCEIRVFRASSMPSKYILSYAKSQNTSTSSLAGWAQPFSLDGKYADAALVILNDRNIGADSGINYRLSTINSPLNLDLESMALHELGHALGLNHVNEIFPVMSGSDLDHLANLAGIKRNSLHLSDKKAIVAIYGGTTSSSTRPANTPQPSTRAKISNEISYIALRQSPGYTNKTDADILASIPAGDVVQILGGPEKADGVSWWNVSWNGTEGWLADHTGSGKTVMIFLP